MRPTTPFSELPIVDEEGGGEEGEGEGEGEGGEGEGEEGGEGEGGEGEGGEGEVEESNDSASAGLHGVLILEIEPNIFIRDPSDERIRELFTESFELDTLTRGEKTILYNELLHGDVDGIIEIIKDNPTMFYDEFWSTLIDRTGGVGDRFEESGIKANGYRKYLLSEVLKKKATLLEQVRAELKRGTYGDCEYTEDEGEDDNTGQDEYIDMTNIITLKSLTPGCNIRDPIAVDTAPTRATAATAPTAPTAPTASTASTAATAPTKGQGTTRRTKRLKPLITPIVTLLNTIIESRDITIISKTIIEMDSKIDDLLKACCIGSDIFVNIEKLREEIEDLVKKYNSMVAKQSKTHKMGKIIEKLTELRDKISNIKPPAGGYRSKHRNTRKSSKLS
jgi:hypothetical protein